MRSDAEPKTVLSVLSNGLGSSSRSDSTRYPLLVQGGGPLQGASLSRSIFTPVLMPLPSPTRISSLRFLSDQPKESLGRSVIECGGAPSKNHSSSASSLRMPSQNPSMSTTTSLTRWAARSGPTTSNRSSRYTYASSLSREYRSPARSSRSSTKALRTL